MIITDSWQPKNKEFLKSHERFYRLEIMVLMAPFNERKVPHIHVGTELNRSCVSVAKQKGEQNSSDLIASDFFCGI